MKRLCTAATLAFSCAALAACSGDAPDDQASAAPDTAASASASASSSSSDNMAVAGPGGISGNVTKSSSSPAAADNAEQEVQTDENGNPIPAGPPQATEEDVRRALEQAQSR
ncbi:hypothetical protein [Novosphingobium sp.]|uniref:hypothetical protein n=1 Tax=Novosphingobium sp. TaxID=1874826 RepID=UPI00260065D1|nr:hypothetical protein [Novosphingobium sp.]